MNVSVIIPCHNAEPYLAQAIGSALDQSCPPHEILVVDDGSTDGSLTIARCFEDRSEHRVRVVSERFGSASRTRNFGDSLATGDALMFLDADDVLGPDALEALTAELAREPGGIAICAWYRLDLVDGRWVKRPPSCRPRQPGQDALSAWLTGWYHPPCSVLWSRVAYERTGGWDPHALINNDGDIIMRALVSGVPLVETAAGSAYYRRLPEGERSLSGTRLTRKGLEARLRVIQKIALQLEEQRRLRPYLAPVREAFREIAAGARERHADLCEQAETYARQYSPSPWARVKERGLRTIQRQGHWFDNVFRRRISGRATPANNGSAEGAIGAKNVEVRFGLDRAEQALRFQSPPPAVDAAERSLLPSRPAVSVVIPTYNRAHLLPRALNSVLAQTFKDFEVLVVDDGSTDETEAVVAGYGDPRVRYLREPANGGVSAARNRGLREARGEFIAFLDSDDEWLPEKLALQIDLLRRSPEDVGLTYTGVESVFGDGRRRVQRPSARGDLYRELLLKNVIHGGGSNVMVRRQVIPEVGFFDEHLPAIEDYDYWLRVGRRYKVDYVSAPLVRYYDSREPVGDATGLRRSRNVQANLAARERFYRRYSAEMKRAGVAHLFLLESARRHLVPAYNDVQGARRLAAQAVWQAPTSGEAYRMLSRTLRLGLREVLRRLTLGRGNAGRAEPTHGSDRTGVRVLLYSSTSRVRVGGVHAVYARLAAGLRRRGHTVVEAWSTPSPSGSRDEAVYALPLLTTRRGIPMPLSALKACWSLLRLGFGLMRRRPEVVNIHFVRREVAYFFLLRRLFGYKVVLSVHGSDVLLPQQQDAEILPRLLPQADAITAVSRPVAANLLSHAEVNSAQVRVIPNGVDFDFWGAPLPYPDVGQRPPVALSVGRLTGVKGIDVLLEAFSLVRERVADAWLIVVGDGECRAELEQLADELGIREAVEFTGHLTPEEVRARMCQARAHVLPSRSEGMPLALLEAMAAGLPPVASRVGGVPDVVLPGTGLLVPAEDPMALAESLAVLLQNHEQASEMGRRAKGRARQFSATATDAAYEDLFLRLIDGSDQLQAECTTDRQSLAHF